MEENFSVLNVHIHPESDTEPGGTQNHDFALVELTEAVYSIMPTPPYEGFDEEGKIIKLVGNGLVGNAIDGVVYECFPCKLHGADNIVTEATDDFLRFRFDEPGTDNSLPLEGVGGPGDSGGPVYIETEMGRFVAGVSSHGSLEYNNFDQYTRVSQQLSWMLEVMGNDYPGVYSGLLYSEINAQKEPNQSSMAEGGGSGSMAPLLLLALALLRRIRLRH